ncbi:complex I subunit 5 family protein [Desulfocastanea catecholica]
MIYTLSICLPIIIGLLVLLPPTRKPAIRFLFPTAALPALIAVLPGAAEDITFPKVLLGMRFSLDICGRTFLFATALVWFVSSLFTLAYMAKNPRLPSFIFFFLLTMSGNFGLILARDIPSFYTFFAIMTFAVYGLIIHDRSPKALQAGNVYLIMALIGEAAVITAIFLTIHSARGIGIEDIAPALQTSPHRGTILVAAFIGFGVKAGAFLLHFWLPLAHPAAPSPASAVLSGCMIKAGLLGWLHFFPAGIVDFPLWGTVFAWFGIIALFYGALLGLFQLDPKTILAYSSISQMGLMTLTLGMGLRDAALWPALLPVLLVLVVNHALAKGTLFLVAGTAPSAGTNSFSQAVLLGGALLPILALAGFPWTGGAAAKHGLLQAAVSSTLFRSVDPAMLFTLSAFATALLLAHFLIRLRESIDRPEKQPLSGLWFSWIALLPVLAAVMTIAPYFMDRMAMATPLAKMTRYAPWTTAWPVLVGLLSALPFRFFSARCTLPDLDLGQKTRQTVEPSVHLILRGMFRLEYFKKLLVRLFRRQYFKLFGIGENSPHAFTWLERRFMHWHTAGLLFVSLLVAFLLLTLFQEGLL